MTAGVGSEAGCLSSIPHRSSATRIFTKIPMFSHLGSSCTNAYLAGRWQVYVVNFELI